MTPTEFDLATTGPTRDRPASPPNDLGGWLESRTEEQLGRLLDCLRGSSGFDFTHYQRRCLARRAAVRMNQVGIRDLERYTDYLRHTPGEGQSLCQTFWINVTDFFRDQPVWDQLRAKVIPELLARKGSASPVRIWSAGCASGQEAYSLAMLLAEALGPEGLHGRVEIYATDVDGEALTQARLGIYPERAMAAVPAALRERYAVRCAAQGENSWRVSDALRRVVRFRRQDLLRSRPRGEFDLIVCRNTLIYFCPDAQRRVLVRLRRGLADGGYLLLGRTESPVFHDQGRPRAECFEPVDLSTRLFARSPRPHPRACSPAHPALTHAPVRPLLTGGLPHGQMCAPD